MGKVQNNVEEVKPYEVLEHTADVGLAVYGSSLAEIFINAAKGMFSLMTALEKVEPVAEVPITIEAEDRETLLVEWLNELLYQLEVTNLFFAEFFINKLTATQLEAVAKGETINPDKHELKLQIKACTYHELKVEKLNSLWRAQVIFDI